MKYRENREYVGKTRASIFLIRWLLATADENISQLLNRTQIFHFRCNYQLAEHFRAPENLVIEEATKNYYIFTYLVAV